MAKILTRRAWEEHHRAWERMKQIKDRISTCDWEDNEARRQLFQEYTAGWKKMTAWFDEYSSGITKVEE